MMKKHRIVSIAFLIGVFLIVSLFLYSCGKMEVYASPEEYCQATGHDTYQIAQGESSVFVIYKKSPGNMGFRILKETDEGFELTRSRIIFKESRAFFAMFIKGSTIDDTYIIFPFAYRHTKEITDARGSSFYFLPTLASEEEDIEMGTYAFAYIGAESKDYYKHEYWYTVETKDGAN